MTYANDSILDSGLSWAATNATTLHICSAEPSSYAGISAVELATAPVTLTGPADVTGGRAVTVPAVSGDDVDTTGTATHYALSNGADTLVFAEALTASVALTSGGTYNFGGATLTLNDLTQA